MMARSGEKFDGKQNDSAVRVAISMRALVFVEAPAWPFAWLPLHTLLMAAGAVEVWPEWDGDWAEGMGVN